MKVISDKTVKGKRRVTVELNDGEKLVAVHPNAFYRLAYPVEDVVSGDIIADCDHVVWCNAEQKWVA